MFQEIRPTGFQILPPVIKNIIIVSALLFLGTFSLKNVNIDLVQLLGLHMPGSQAFKIWQPVTYLFMHGSFGHLFFNMFSFWMFGAPLENYWGSKRFLQYFLLTGLGAAILHYSVVYAVDLRPILAQFKDQMQSLSGLDQLYAQEQYENILSMPNIIGASGAVAGVMAAFGYLFPNSVLYLYFAIPVKAKYIVGFYFIYELYQAYLSLGSSATDNIAHFAHVGGFLMGLAIVKWVYQSNRSRFY